jgi:hypothetical protein
MYVCVSENNYLQARQFRVFGAQLCREGLRVARVPPREREGEVRGEGVGEGVEGLHRGELACFSGV